MSAVPVVGRFAPTPSGRLHLGNIACAMLAWVSAKAQGGKCLLRIEDIDLPRCPSRLTQAMLRDIEWLGIPFDGPLLIQSERGAVYEEALGRLRAQGLIYPCFCTRAQLMASAALAPNLGDTQVVYRGTCARLTGAEIEALSRTRKPALRVRVEEREVTVADRVQGNFAENLARDCGDFIVRRSDGLWGYQLAAVVDDALTGVTEVVRGRDILSSTPRQMYLLEKLGAPIPTYAHIPLLMDSQGRRLAKRDGDLCLDSLAKRFTPEAIFGALACAYGLRETPAPVSLEKLAEDFTWDKVKREDVRRPESLTIS